MKLMLFQVSRVTYGRNFLLVMEKRTYTARSCCKAYRAYLLSGNVGM